MFISRLFYSLIKANAMNLLFTIILMLISAGALVAMYKYKILPFGMNVQEQPPGFPKKTMVLPITTQITSTTDPLFRIKMPVGLTPLAARITPLTEFDRTTQDETYVLSVEDDGTKISTDNAAVATADKTKPIECTFASGTHVDKDSYLEFIVTLGGTTPIIAANSVLEFDYLEG